MGSVQGESALRSSRTGAFDLDLLGLNRLSDRAYQIAPMFTTIGPIARTFLRDIFDPLALSLAPALRPCGVFSPGKSSYLRTRTNSTTIRI